MGLISIRARNLKLGSGDSKHLYVVYNYSNGEKFIIRGGPTEEVGGEWAGIMFGDLEVVHQPYKIVDGKNPPDWEEDEAHPKREIEIPDDELKEKVDLILKEVSRINNSKYDYKVPLIEGLIGDGLGDLNDQNSNTAIKYVLGACGLGDDLLTFLLEKNIDAPGHMATLEDSGRDRSMDQFAKKLTQTGKTVIDFMEDLSLRLGRALGWLLESAASLFKELTRAWLKAIGIDPRKPVRVIEESETGRNLLFADQLSGRIMSRAGFVSSIEGGDYPGYWVSHINGLATPVSKSDGKTYNNLG